MAKEIQVVDKLIMKLKELQDENLKMAVADSGVTATSGSTLPSVMVAEINPLKTTVSYSAIGAPVMVTDAKGKEVVASDGTIEVKEVLAADGTVEKPAQILTIEKGKLLSIEDKPAEIEPVTSGSTEMSKVNIVIPVIEMAGEKEYPFDKCVADNTAKYGAEGAKKVCGAIKARVGMSKEEAQPILEMSKDAEDFEKNLEVKMAQSTATAVQSALQRAGFDLSKAGQYCLDFTVGEDGTMQYGQFRATTYQDLMLAKEKIEKDVDDKLKEITVQMSKQKENYEKVIKTLNTPSKGINNVPEVEEQKPLVKLSKEEQRKVEIKAEIMALKNK